MNDIGAINWGSATQYTLPKLKGLNELNEPNKSALKNIIIHSKNWASAPELTPQIFYDENNSNS